MTYKQTLFFIGECLSLVKYPERREVLLQQIQSEFINWDNVVKEGSNQMVIPTLYFNLKRAQLLNFLPQGLEAYFKKITQLNINRNRAIVSQISQLASLCETNDIKAIFLKGTAHLVEGLYQDIGERMIGDIDFLVDKNELEKTVSVLKEVGYTNLFENEKLEKPRHYARLVHKDFIAAVEIHWDILEQNNKHQLQYEILLKDARKIENIYVPSYKHQALHNMLNAQVNDHSYYRGLILVRQLYDCLLLTSKEGVIDVFKSYKNNYFLKNIYLKWATILFKIKPELHQKSLFLNVLMLRYHLKTNLKTNHIITEGSYFFGRLYNYPRQIILALNNRKKRQNIIKHLKTKGWLKHHIQTYKSRR